MKLIRTLVLTLAVLCACSLDASAQLAVKKISFTSTSGTPPFDQAVTGVGLGVAGEAILFYWTDQTAEGTAAHQQIGFGCAVSSTSRWAVAVSNQDNVATTNTARISSSSLAIVGIDFDAGLNFTADFKTFDGADGNFTVTWTTNPGAGRIFHAIVFGGPDLTNSVCTLLDLNANTGNQAYAHGLGATPSFGFYATINNTATPGTTHSTLAVGWAVSDSKRGSVTRGADDGITMTASMDWVESVNSARALWCFTPNSAAIDIEFDHVSFDSTNVTFNQINAPTSGTDLYALFLAGGQYDAGSFAAATGGGNQNFTVGFTPKVVAFAGSQQAITSATVFTDSNFYFGAGTSTDGTQEGAVSVASTDAVLNVQADQRTVTTKVISSLIDGAPGSVDGEADLTALGTTSTINWTDAPSTADIVIWWAAGDAGAPPTPARRRVIITSLEPREYEVAEVR